MEDLFVYNSEYEIMGMFQNPISYLYVEQLRGKGEFEISLPLTDENSQLAIKDYIVCFDFDKGIAGIIQNTEIENPGNEGSIRLTVSGSLISTYLYRRVCWGLYSASGKPLQVINDMVNKQVVNPEDEDRAISDIELETPDDVGTIIQYQNTGGNVGEALEALAAKLQAK